MASEVRAVIAAKACAPAEVRTILVPDPGPGEVLFAVQGCGICPADLRYREGKTTDAFPVLLGHEAAGTVEAIGPGVTDVSPGDFAVLAWRAPCGQCRSCRRGRPWYCFDSRHAAQPMTLTDGTPLTAAHGIGALAEKTLVAEGQVVKVDPAARPEVAGLVGCAVVTGFGAAVHTGGVQRGDTAAVIGCGSVGNAAIAGARLSGARLVIAIDIDGARLDATTRFGATHTIHAGGRGGTDAVEAVRDLTDGIGVDVVIDTVGSPETYRQAFYLRDRAGVLVQAGLPEDSTQRVDLPLADLFERGGALKPSWYGDCLPSRDFPALIDLYLSRRLDLERFVTETITLDETEPALERLARGEVLRSVVVP